jgi:exodeoxyribonuclease III
MQIATWNVNSLKVRLPQVLDWLQSSGCDALALQELKLDNPFFPVEAFAEIGYNCAFNGQKTYNGVAIISKHPITDITHDIPNYADVQKRVISATINSIRLICVYVVNGESVESDKYQYKLQWLEQLRHYVKESLSVHNKVAVLGDFNIAPHDTDVYDPQQWAGKVLCSIPEREKWQELLNLGLHDSFRIFNQESGQYSWWDYRNFAFRRKLGLRIDHILISDALKAQVINCAIDVNPRKNERPSDHTPVILQLK